jgi:ankyrin repeat protein
MFLISFVKDANKYLKIACKFNHISIMKYLIQFGCDINILNDNIPKIITVDMMIFLNKCGLQISEEILNKSLLDDFIMQNHTNNFSYFIEHGASMKYIFDMQKTGNNPHYAGNYPLESIIWQGKINHIKYLCENYYDFICHDFDTLILMACGYGQCDIIKYLHGCGGIINDLALIVACYFRKLNVIELLLDYGIDYDIRENLFCVLEEGYYKKCKDSRIYDEVINKNYIFKSKNLLWGNIDSVRSIRNIIKKLIPLNIPIPNNSKFWSYETLIIFDIDILQYYLDCGNDLNGKSDKSVVEICIEYGYPDVVKFLLDNGANWPSQKCLDTYCKHNKKYKDMFNL